VSLPWVTKVMATGLARELPGEAVRVRRRKCAEAALVSTTRLTRDGAREARRSAPRGAWADDAGNQLMPTGTRIKQVGLPAAKRVDGVRLSLLAGAICRHAEPSRTCGRSWASHHGRKRSMSCAL
jgi:hypothetical protein